MADHDFIFRASLIKTFAIAFGRRLSTDLLASLPGPLEVGFRNFLEASFVVGEKFQAAKLVKIKRTILRYSKWKNRPDS